MARHTPNGGKTESHYRRLQRLIANAMINYDQLAMLIYRLFGLGKVTLNIDRTNWKNHHGKLVQMKGLFCHVTAFRVSKLVAVNTLAFCWAYHIGIHKDKGKPLKRKLKPNGRPQVSLLALALDLLFEGLCLVLLNNDRAVFRQLLNFLTPKPMKIGWSWFFIVC